MTNTTTPYESKDHPVLAVPRCHQYTSSTGVLSPGVQTPARVSYQPTNQVSQKPDGTVKGSLPLSRLFPGTPETLKSLQNPTVGEKGERGGVVLATFKDNHRHKSHHRDGVALGLDYENKNGPATQLSEAVAVLAPYCGIYYTTSNHTPSSHRFRVIIPLSRTVTAVEYSDVAEFFTNLLVTDHHHHLDLGACKNPAGVWYLPVLLREEDREHYVYGSLPGNAHLDVDAILTEVKKKKIDHTRWLARERQNRSRVNRSSPSNTPPHARSWTLDKPWCACFGSSAETTLREIREAPPGTRHDTLRNKSAFLATMIEGDSSRASYLIDAILRATREGGYDNPTADLATVRDGVQYGLNNLPPLDFPTPQKKKASPTSTPSPTTATILETATWKAELIHDADGVISNTDANLYRIVENDRRWADLVRFNARSNRVETFDGRIYGKDAVKTRMTQWFSQEYGFRNIKEGALARITSMVIQDRILPQNAWDPLVEWLNSLPKWDRVDRISTVFHRYLGAPDNELQREISKLFFMGLVMRAIHPGSSLPYMFVFQGEQGVGKDDLLNIVANGRYRDPRATILGRDYNFTGSIVDDLKNPDSIRLLMSSWLVIIPEGEAMTRTSLKTLKDSITKLSDEYRFLFTDFHEKKPRGCVLTMTTNETCDVIEDPSGMRRFLVVPCAKVPGNDKAQFWLSLVAERDQLFAEAMELWERQNKTPSLILPTHLWRDQEALAQDSIGTERVALGSMRRYLERGGDGGKPVLCCDIKEVLDNVEDIGKEFPSRKAQANWVASQLRNHGFTSRQSSFKGRKGRVFFRSNAGDPPPPLDTDPTPSRDEIRAALKNLYRSGGKEISFDIVRNVTAAPNVEPDEPDPRELQREIARSKGEGEVEEDDDYALHSLM